MSALEENNEQIEEIVRNLRKKHDNHYTSMQYRL